VVLDGATAAEITRIAVGGALGVITANSANGLVYAVDSDAARIYVPVDDHYLAVIDATNGEIAMSNKLWPNNQRLTTIAVNPNTNHLYLASQATASVQILDGATITVLATVPIPSGGSSGTAIYGIGVELSTNQIYVASGNQDIATTPNSSSFMVSIINGETFQVIDSLPMDAQPYALAVNPVSHHVYVVTGDHVTMLAP
jgi:DNA-binding beta-propeller fold protein YncE